MQQLSSLILEQFMVRFIQQRQETDLTPQQSADIQHEIFFFPAQKITATQPTHSQSQHHLHIISCNIIYWYRRVLILTDASATVLNNEVDQ